MPLWAPACLRVADSRVERDQAVGKAESEGTELQVLEGLAVVRQLEPGRIELWGSAPAFEVSLQLADDAPRQWQLSAMNLMAGAGLSLADGTVIEPSERGNKTSASWQLELTPGAQTTLRIGALDQPKEPFFFAQLNDVQEAIDGFSDLIARVNLEPELSFVLGAGDLTEQGSVAELQRFERELEALNVPYFATLGNHELGEDPPPYHDLFGRGNYSFVYRGVRFTLLDSASATLAPKVYNWLDDWLRQGQNQVHIVAMHIPPLDPSGTRHGAFASKDEAAKLLNKLMLGGVDLTLYGHIHTYVRFENAGIPAYIVAGGGALPVRGDGIGRHYAVTEVSAEQGVVATHRVEVDGDWDY
jgi:predicted phosphodiesterase